MAQGARVLQTVSTATEPRELESGSGHPAGQERNGTPEPITRMLAGNTGARSAMGARPLLAQSGHALVHCTCPLLGVKRTFRSSARYAACFVFASERARAFFPSLAAAAMLSKKIEELFNGPHRQAR